MLLFHGTMEPALDGLLQHGLQPPQPRDSNHDWVWDLSGRSQGSAVFLSTAPVAGQGGDPVSFAMGWPIKRFAPHPGYIIVVDLPPDALDLVHAVVPNVELDSFISVYRTRALLRETFRVEANDVGQDASRPIAKWNLSHWCLHYWLARYCADHGIPLKAHALDELLGPPTGYIDSALPSDMTPLRWQAFLDDYFRFVDFAYRDVDSPAERERKRQHILRVHGIVLPEHVEEDDHSKHCRLCLGGLANFAHLFDGFADYEPMLAFLNSVPKKSGFQRLQWSRARLRPYVISVERRNGGLGVVQPLAMRLRAVVAHTAPFPEETVVRFFCDGESPQKHTPESPWTWDDWYEHFPGANCTLAPAWLPGYCRSFSAADLKLPDRQVIAAAIPPSHIIGAIKISDGARLLPHVRPNRRNGETLISKLWTLTHQIRARYAGTPVILD